MVAALGKRGDEAVGCCLHCRRRAREGRRWFAVVTSDLRSPWCQLNLFVGYVMGSQCDTTINAKNDCESHK